MIFISHNLGVVARLCDRIAVMYAGAMVELVQIDSRTFQPLHPYTAGLLDAMPRPERRDDYLKALPGNICDLVNPPLGCKFHPRCSRAQQICAGSQPRLEEKAERHSVACFFPVES